MRFALPAWQSVLLRHGRLLLVLALLAAGLAAVAAAHVGRLPRTLPWLAPVLVLAVALAAAWTRWRRERLIREGPLPQFLKRKLQDHYPQLDRRDAELVERGLRQFFLACHRSGGRGVAMPSRAVDAMWHDFILHTQAYRDWCALALGRFLHHTPAEALGRNASHNDALRRAWFWSCRDEAIDPRRPSRLPLLFALDTKLGIPNGFRYVPDCRLLGAANAAGGDSPYCGTSFGDGSAAGDGDHFGGAESPSHGGGDGDGGCSSDGGCSGGGGD